MVLLAGDLFHDNKPSRRTLHKTIEIIRRYTLGPKPVKIQILSDQKKNFRSLYGQVNYEDKYHSVHLPIFSIHGNHDDPTRDGGGEMLAALDLLAVSNLVNYFGRQDNAKAVEVSPILMQKGNTRVALYGMGSMRDERLNRMWVQKNVRFLRPQGCSSSENNNDDDEETGADNSDWFNIFVLHQNRDTGRGKKNCVHESMIPTFCDLVVWGHEHACEILPAESVVGTFRITQPGSTVATSLTQGEAVRKQVAILNVRRSQFKIEPIPLTMVRSFVMKDVSLTNYDNLDPEDPKIDDKITAILNDELELCIHNAKEKTEELLKDAKKAGNDMVDDQDDMVYKLQRRDEYLVRLRVEHSGFSTLNNQRFGAKFVGRVANPTDILLFSRNKVQTAGVSQAKKKSKGSGALDEPVAPEELQQTSVEDLVKENLESADQKLELLKEKQLGLALEEFVEKGETKAIIDLVDTSIRKRQTKTLSSGGVDKDGDGEKNSQEDARPSKRKRDPPSDDDDVNQDDEESRNKENLAQESASASDSGKQKVSSQAKRSTKGSKESIKSSCNESIMESDGDDEEHGDDENGKRQSNKSKDWTNIASSKKRTNKTRRSSDESNTRSVFDSHPPATSQRRKTTRDDDEDFGDNDSVEVVSKKRSSPRRRTAKARVNYAVDAGSDDGDIAADSDSDDEPPQKKARSPRNAASSFRGKATDRRKTKSQDSSMELDDDWGSASTRTHK